MALLRPKWLMRVCSRDIRWFLGAIGSRDLLFQLNGRWLFGGSIMGSFLLGIFSISRVFLGLRNVSFATLPLRIWIICPAYALGFDTLFRRLPGVPSVRKFLPFGGFMS
ncbi:hypothetical protein ACS0TY_034511 [Phlomoides rotata]